MRLPRTTLLFVLIFSDLFAFNLSAKERAREAWFIDVGGGQATLLVAPPGESLSVDTGWPGFNDRDAVRIANAARASGLEKSTMCLSLITAPITRKACSNC